MLIKNNDFFFVDVLECRLRIKRIIPDSVDLSRPVLVFLHEGLGCIEFWKDFPEMVCSLSRCKGIIYDRKGYGAMTDKFNKRWPHDYLVQEAEVYLPALLKACKIDNAILIGHSDGGSIALLAAAIHKNMVRSIITKAAHVFVEDITLKGVQQAVNAYKKDSLKLKLSKYHSKNTDTIFFRWADTWLDSDFRYWNIESFLPEIQCPALILQGMEDEYATIKQVKKIVSQVSGTAASHLIPDCGHIPHFQAQKAVLAVMIPFIESCL